ncbi:four helix bundle protein [Novipirellula rosea]|uniref:Four helix bundle protein n=1 Tax=Novipirellula rosea TaxID=1031540 RepID=A0ABP8MN38_9BACT
MDERKKTIRKHTDLDFYKHSFATAMHLFELSRKFPLEEQYSLTDQCRRSSRSVSANIAEAWRKRRYPAAFVAKLSDSEAEAAETPTWLQFAVECKYLDADVARELYCECDKIIGMLVNMIRKPDSWRLRPDEKRSTKTIESHEPPNTENEQ